MAVLLFTPKEVVSMTVFDPKDGVLYPRINASCSECAMAVVRRTIAKTMKMTSNNHARWKEGEESDDERVDAVDFPNHGTLRGIRM